MPNKQIETAVSKLNILKLNVRGYVIEIYRIASLKIIKPEKYDNYFYSNKLRTKYILVVPLSISSYNHILNLRVNWGHRGSINWKNIKIFCLTLMGREDFRYPVQGKGSFLLIKQMHPWKNLNWHDFIQFWG